MRGEELQGLTIEELHQLEKSLEGGMKRVMETMVPPAAIYTSFIFI